MLITNVKAAQKATESAIEAINRRIAPTARLRIRSARPHAATNGDPRPTDADLPGRIAVVMSELAFGGQTATREAIALRGGFTRADLSEENCARARDIATRHAIRRLDREPA